MAVSNIAVLLSGFAAVGRLEGGLADEQKMCGAKPIELSMVILGYFI